MRNHYSEYITVHLTQQWKKKCQVGEERTKAIFTQK